jgi:hypothetical protein
MSKYLLTCTCGNEVPVEIGQAGGRVACTCGAQLDVPTLRQLRHLPQEKAAETGAAASWGTHQGWIAAALIFVAALLAWTAWSWWTQPSQPKFDATHAVEHMALVDQNLKKWTPTDGWNLWIEHYRPLSERGLGVFHAQNAAQIETKIAEARFLRGMLLTMAVVFAAVAAAIAFWPRPVAKKTGRRGDGVTGRG